MDARDKPGQGVFADSGVEATVGEVLEGCAVSLAAAALQEPRRLARRIVVEALGLPPASR